MSRSLSPLHPVAVFVGSLLLLLAPFLMTACEEREELPPPPVGGSGGGPPVQAPEPDEPPPPPTPCEDYQVCVLKCAQVSFGEDTQVARERCVQNCPSPDAGMGSDFETQWGLACADAPADLQLCDEGYEFCKLLSGEEE